MPPKLHPLARARKIKGLSQLDLGKELFADSSEDEMTKARIQKRISLFETGSELPTPVEFEKLSNYFDVPEEEVRDWFKREPRSAAELFAELAASPYPCLVSACFSGLPRTVGNEAFDQLLLGIRHQVSVAMYFPYPRTIDRKADSEEDVYFLEYAYARSRVDVESHYSRLYCQLSDADRQKRLALYVPWNSNSINTVLPPNSTRYTLIVQLSEDGKLTQKLYIWVEAERKDDLFLVGSLSDVNPTEQLRVWSAYFGAPVRRWIDTQGAALPGDKEDHRVGIWLREFPG